jgi:hypothetical protein
MAEEIKAPFEKLAPWASIPNVFADGVMSQSYGPGISKFYLYRTDGDPHAQVEPVNTPIVQVIMPAAGFVRTWAFFGARIKTMIDEGFLTQEQVDALTKAGSGEP